MGGGSRSEQAKVKDQLGWMDARFGGDWLQRNKKKKKKRWILRRWGGRHSGKRDRTTCLSGRAPSSFCSFPPSFVPLNNAHSAGVGLDRLRGRKRGNPKYTTRGAHASPLWLPCPPLSVSQLASGGKGGEQGRGGGEKGEQLTSELTGVGLPEPSQHRLKVGDRGDFLWCRVAVQIAAWFACILHWI